MSQQPYYNQQPQGYEPQGYNPGYPPQYPQGPYTQQPQPQVIYQQEQRRDNSLCGQDCCCNWLLTLLCGCAIGELCCDSPMLCCYIPIPCPRWR